MEKKKRKESEVLSTKRKRNSLPVPDIPSSDDETAGSTKKDKKGKGKDLCVNKEKGKELCSNEKNGKGKEMKRRGQQRKHLQWLQIQSWTTH